MSPRLAFALETARLAGDSTLGLFRGGRGFSLKRDESPVTVADLEAEAIVRRQIEKFFPGEAVLGEEQGGEAGADRWVVDPIDGTKSFVAGVPLYATLLAYEAGGEPVVGVAYFPALDDIVYAEKGVGCHWNGEACRVSTETEPKRMIVCCGGHASMQKHDRTKGILGLARQVMATRTWCDAYGHALVATGRAHAMIDPVVSRWDISAMAVIVREAGGSFTDFSGNDGLTTEAVSACPGARDLVLGAFA